MFAISNTQYYLHHLRVRVRNIEMFYNTQVGSYTNTKCPLNTISMRNCKTQINECETEILCQLTMIQSKYYELE